MLRTSKKKSTTKENNFIGEKMDTYEKRMEAQERLQEKIKVVGKIAAGIFILFILVVISQYRVDTGEAAILTTWRGEKLPVTGLGYHTQYPFIESTKIYTVVNNAIYFPQDLKALQANFQPDAQSGSICYDINTLDNKVVDTCGIIHERSTHCFVKETSHDLNR
jgi:hypothetical protein